MSTIDFPFFCYLSSDADKQIFSTNDKTDFTNELEYPLNPREGTSNRLFVKLKSIAFWQDIESPEDNADTHIIKIRLEELEHTPGAKTFDRTLGTIPFEPIPSVNKYRVIEHPSTYLPIRPIPLHHLHITLLDSKDQKIRLKKYFLPNTGHS